MPDSPRPQKPSKTRSRIELKNGSGDDDDDAWEAHLPSISDTRAASPGNSTGDGQGPEDTFSPPLWSGTTWPEESQVRWPWCCRTSDAPDPRGPSCRGLPLGGGEDTAPSVRGLPRGVPRKGGGGGGSTGGQEG
ncbi:uncharacterized protein A4U43_C08F34080 [Asparagus officinalis]|nr:uncharacterized protein A4U43_C08F34080 [Asparagus officinalis]